MACLMMKLIVGLDGGEQYFLVASMGDENAGRHEVQTREQQLVCGAVCFETIPAKLRECLGQGCYGWLLLKHWRRFLTVKLLECCDWKLDWCRMRIWFWGQVSEFLEQAGQGISNAVAVTGAAEWMNWCWAEINVSLCRNCMMAGESAQRLFRISTSAVLSEWTQVRWWSLCRRWKCHSKKTGNVATGGFPFCMHHLERLYHGEMGWLQVQ